MRDKKANTVNEQDNPLGYEKESKLLVGFAIPCIISMLVTALYNIVDQIFIGQGVGMLGNAATNIAFPLSTSCTAISLLLGIGSATNFSYPSGLSCSFTVFAFLSLIQFIAYYISRQPFPDFRQKSTDLLP